MKILVPAISAMALVISIIIVIYLITAPRVTDRPTLTYTPSVNSGVCSISIGGEEKWVFVSDKDSVQSYTIMTDTFIVLDEEGNVIHEMGPTEFFRKYKIVKR